jgi:hypothetical protein
MMKSDIDDLSVEDLKNFPVWRVKSNARTGDSELVPVRRLPCKNLDCCIVGVQVMLADESTTYGILGNVHTNDRERTEVFVTISIEKNGEWFHLARYFDCDFNSSGPKELGKFLGKKLNEIFPIRYDLRLFSKGDLSALCGVILVAPKKRLTEDEIMEMALRD